MSMHSNSRAVYLYLNGLVVQMVARGGDDPEGSDHHCRINKDVVTSTLLIGPIGELLVEGVSLLLLLCELAKNVYNS